MDQMFAVRQVCEKFITNLKYGFLEFMDLKKSNDIVDGHTMW